jgi:hypothetical protein
MRKHVRYGVFVVFVLLLMLVGVTLAQAQKSVGSGTNATSPDAGPSWNGQYIQHVDYPFDVGTYVSLAINPIDNLPQVSYYDAYNGNLMYAHYIPSGNGNCGTSNHWYCEAIDEAGDVGTATSIDIWKVDVDSYKVGISYHDVTNAALKYISWTCNPLTCTIKNDITVSSPDFNWLYMGVDTSMKLGPDGSPIIAYYQENTIGDDSLRIASYVGSGGNCGEGSAAGTWQCDMIGLGEGFGQHVSLDLTYDGTPYIAFYDAYYGDLRVAYYLGFSSNDCYDENGWECPLIDPNYDVGDYASITAQHVVGDQQFRIAYYDKDNHKLKYYDPEWGILTVEEMDPNSSISGISMDVDSHGYPSIAYEKISALDAPATLSIARSYLVYNDGNFGNCGDTPPGYLFPYWRCSVLDNAGQYLTEAEYVSMEISPSGSPQIAYSEYYSYDIGDHATSLKFISERFQLFMPLLLKP